MALVFTKDGSHTKDPNVSTTPPALTRALLQIKRSSVKPYSIIRQPWTLSVGITGSSIAPSCKEVLGNLETELQVRQASVD